MVELSQGCANSDEEAGHAVLDRLALSRHPCA
jgi:hypothetical protein